jgi:hypothetical protein
MPPAVWCSVRRLMKNTYGKTSAWGCGGLGSMGLSGRWYTTRAGLACWPYRAFETGDSGGS